MFGPVFRLEMILGSRRGRQHAFRWLYAGWLVVQLMFLFVLYRGTATDQPCNATAAFASGYVETFLRQQFVLVLLAVPVFAAGAVTDEKTRGTLQHLLCADLTPAEVVVGKLLARSYQVLTLVLAGLPVLCFVGVFAGLTAGQLLAVTAAQAGPVFGLAAASILSSVWHRTTRDAVLALYLFLGLAWAAGALATGTTPLHPLAAPVWQAVAGLAAALDPLYVLQPAGLPGGSLAARLLLSLSVWGALGVACAALAALRLQSAYRAQLEGGSARSWFGRRRSAALRDVGDNPLLWKEGSVEGVSPVGALRAVPGWVAVLAAAAAGFAGGFLALWAGLRSNDPVLALVSLVSDGPGPLWEELNGSDAPGWVTSQAAVAMLVASAVVGMRASGVFTGEREKMTLEAVLLTPMETRQIVQGKFWGVQLAALPYLLAYTLPLLAWAVVIGPVSLMLAALLFGVTLLAMYFIGAAGVWCSARSKSSWRSLLGTMAIGYLGGGALYLLVTPVWFALFVALMIVFSIADNALGTGVVAAGGGRAFGAAVWPAFVVASCLVMAGAFYGMAQLFLYWSVKHVAERERVRVWRDTATPRRAVRRVVPA